MTGDTLETHSFARRDLERAQISQDFGWKNAGIVETRATCHRSIKASDDAIKYLVKSHAIRTNVYSLSCLY